MTHFDYDQSHLSKKMRFSIHTSTTPLTADLLLLLTTLDPFSTWSCAFCSMAQSSCRCLSTPTTPVPTPKAKPHFLSLLANECREIAKLQTACTSYLFALEKYVPLGESFNVDQEVKIGRMRVQLEALRGRFETLRTVTEMLAGWEEVPSELRLACDRARALLANCYGNVRECHVCLKLNYMLVAGEEKNKAEEEKGAKAEEEMGVKGDKEKNAMGRKKRKWTEEREWEEGWERKPMLSGMREVEVAA